MQEYREDDEKALLKLLSINARITNEDIAKRLHLSKQEASKLFDYVVSKYGLKFVPEISLENMWHVEFAKQARLQTKRGIIGEANELVSNAGFNEYSLKINFIGSKPGKEELYEAARSIPEMQFITMTSGHYDAWAYLVSRSFEDIRYALSNFNKKLEKYDKKENLAKIKTNFGFFALNKQLVERFNIFESYRNLLSGLIENGRATFTEIGAKYQQGSTQMLYAYDRLVRIGVLKRVTYYETKPERTEASIIEIAITNEAKFEREKERWYLRMVDEANKSECKYTYIADTLSPLGLIAIINTKTEKEINEEENALKKMNGATIETTEITEPVIGSMGIRNFDMRYSCIYDYLELKNKVPRFEREQINTVNVEMNPQEEFARF